MIAKMNKKNIGMNKPLVKPKIKPAPKRTSPRPRPRKNDPWTVPGPKINPTPKA